MEQTNRILQETLEVSGISIAVCVRRDGSDPPLIVSYNDADPGGIPLQAGRGVQKQLKAF